MSRNPGSYGLKITASASYGVCQVVASTSQLATEDFHHLDGVRYVDDCSPSEKVVSYANIEALMASSLL